jgi:hypothetical protein
MEVKEFSKLGKQKNVYKIVLIFIFNIYGNEFSV